MDKRERPIYKGIFFSEQEWQQVATKMAESDMPNFSAFCREMLLTGKVKHYDFSVIKEISSSLSHISGNINQTSSKEAVQLVYIPVGSIAMCQLAARRRENQSVALN